LKEKQPCARTVVLSLLDSPEAGVRSQQLQGLELRLDYGLGFPNNQIVRRIHMKTISSLAVWFHMFLDYLLYVFLSFFAPATAKNCITAYGGFFLLKTEFC